MVLFADDFSVIELSSSKLDYDVTSRVFVPGRVFCSISFRLSGEITVTGERQTYHVTPQSIFYLPSGYDYSTVITGAGSIYVIHFWVDAGYPQEPFVWRPEEPQMYERLFAQIVEGTPPGRRQDFATMGLFYRLLAQIRKDSQNPDKMIPKRMLRAKEMIHRNFNEPTLSVEMLAREAEISQTYFRREFKACFGCQPIAYIRNVRMEHARSLLEAGDYSVSEVAIQSGYENVSYFSYDFHRVTGQSPSHYRQSAAQ